MKYTFFCYARWQTCRKAKAWLDDKGITYEFRDIKQDPPTVQELSGLIKRGTHPLKAFFNTRGQSYRELKLKDRLPTLTEQEQIELLAGDGMLIKRPLLIGPEQVLIGFKEDEWETMLTKN